MTLDPTPYVRFSLADKKNFSDSLGWDGMPIGTLIEATSKGFARNKTVADNMVLIPHMPLVCLQCVQKL
jgi:hypothetical protein